MRLAVGYYEVDLVGNSSPGTETVLEAGYEQGFSSGLSGTLAVGPPLDPEASTVRSFTIQSGTFTIRR